jgi:hypothetical protein
VDEDYRRIMSLFPDHTTDGTLHHAILIAVGEIERLRGASVTSESASRLWTHGTVESFVTALADRVAVLETEVQSLRGVALKPAGHRWIDVSLAEDLGRRRQRWMCNCGKRATTYDDPHGNPQPPDEATDA